MARLSLPIDTLAYFKGLEAAGIPTDQALMYARALRNALSTHHSFNTLVYAFELKEGGVPWDQARAMARAHFKAINRYLAATAEESRSHRRSS